MSMNKSINILEKIQKYISVNNMGNMLSKYDTSEYHLDEYIRDHKPLRKYLSTILDNIIQDINNNECSKLNSTLNLSREEYNTLLEYIYHIVKGLHTEFMSIDMFRKYNMIDLSKYIYEDSLSNVYKIGKQKTYVRWDSINNKSIYEDVDHCIYPCGYSTELKRNNDIHNCIQCKVIMGKSRASTGTQKFVSDLFKIGITNKTSSSGNYYSSGNYIHHYNTIEGIRTNNNKLIRNSECWSAGFAECSFYTDISLPLTTLSKNFDVLNIDILDDKDDFVLFNIDNKCILYGLDRQYYTKFLIEVEGDKVRTVKEALNYINPLSEYKEDSYVRHGSLFFLPTFREFNNFEKQHYTELEKALNWEQEKELGNILKAKIDDIYPKLLNFTKFEYEYERDNMYNYKRDDKGNYIIKNKQIRTGSFTDIDSIKRFLRKIKEGNLLSIDKGEFISGGCEDNIVLLNEADNKRLFETYTKTVDDFYDTIKAPKQLVRPNILDTRHTAQFKCIEDNNEYVKGYVYNGSNKRIFLPTWCKAFKSSAKSIWSV